MSDEKNLYESETRRTTAEVIAFCSSAVVGDRRPSTLMAASWR